MADECQECSSRRGIAIVLAFIGFIVLPIAGAIIMVPRSENFKYERMQRVEQLLADNGFTVDKGIVIGDFWGHDQMIVVKEMQSFMSTAKSLNVTTIYLYEGALVELTFLYDNTLYEHRVW